MATRTFTRTRRIRTALSTFGNTTAGGTISLSQSYANFDQIEIRCGSNGSGGIHLETFPVYYINSSDEYNISYAGNSGVLKFPTETSIKFESGTGQIRQISGISYR